MNVWGPGDGSFYLAGGTPDAGRLTRYQDGTAEDVTLPLQVPLLNWSFGFGPNDITVVGNGGTILHYDGSGWTTQASPTSEDLWGVWGAASDDLWAVGGGGRPGNEATLIHFDGDSWTTVSLPPLERPGVHAFYKVWGADASHVYVVGQRGVMLRYDGSTWTEFGVGVSDDLISVWGTSADRIAVVGGRGNGVISTFDGTEWRTTNLAPLPGLNGVFMRDPDTVHVVGIEGQIARVDFETHEYIDDYQDTRLTYHSIFADERGQALAVGGNLGAVEGPYESLVSTRTLKEGE